LYFPDFILIYLLEATNDFIEGNAATNSDKVQLDKVDASCWLNVDVTNKLIAVDNCWSIVGIVTNNSEVINATATLYISQEWFYESNKL